MKPSEVRNLGIGALLSGIFGALAGMFLVLAWATSFSGQSLGRGATIIVVTSAGYLTGLVSAACYAVIAWIFAQSPAEEPETRKGGVRDAMGRGEAARRESAP